MSIGYAAWIVAIEIAIVVAMPIASELGFRAGVRRHPDEADPLKGQVGIVQTAAFAILGLLAAFTLSMAEARFTGRRQLILDESNAIGTSYLRSKYLLAPHAAELAPLFRRYVDARVAFYAAYDDVDASLRAAEDARRLQREIWAHTVAVVRADPDHGDSVAAFVESLNTMIDLENARIAAIETHVPASIFVLLALIALFASATSGYACGLEGRRVWLSVAVMPVLVGVALAVVFDLDSPRLGLITSGQAPMVRLQRVIHAEVGAP